MNISRRLNGVQTLNVCLAYAARLSALLLAILALLVPLQAQSDYSTPFTFTTLAGNAGYGSVDGTGIAAQFNGPTGAAVDGSGNIYVGDRYNHTIRKITPAGAVTTIAGLAGNSGSADGTGNAARFHDPQGVAVDSVGNLYVADSTNSTVRKITSSGVVTTLAGTAGSSGATDGTGSAARFSGPTSVAVDGSGNVYVADCNNNKIRKITATGVVTTLAGSGSFGTADGTGGAAQFSHPTGVAVDVSGNVYVTDTLNFTIRMITPAGVVTTIAGRAYFYGSEDGTGSAARFESPHGVAIDTLGNIYVSELHDETIRKITPAGVVSTLAGAAHQFGSTDGTGSSARFYSPTGLAVDVSGNVYVADTFYSTIRKITTEAVVTTVVGAAPSVGSTDGAGITARFDSPGGAAVDLAGNVYVSDYGNHTIRKVTAAGVVTTFAGSAGSSGATDGAGSLARFNQPRGVAVDGSGNVYVGDNGNHTIRKITSTGLVTTLAGTSGSAGSVDEMGNLARFNFPSGVAIDGVGSVYVADFGNHTIRKITAAGVVTTFAGLAGNNGSMDGTGSAGRFNSPNGIAVDGFGNVYVADFGNNTIRKITSEGVVTTVAGTAGSLTGGLTDGIGSAAKFYAPSSVAVDGSGNLYITDTNNNTIRRITAAGVVTTLAGNASGEPGRSSATDGVGSAARFYSPAGVAVDGAGNVYVADSGNNTIRKGVPPDEVPSISTQPVSQTIAGDSLVSFTVVASGYPAPTYQWQKNGVAIVGATNSSYTILSVGEGDAGSYTVVATNSVGAVTSNGAVLTTFVAAPSGAVISFTVE